MKFTDIKATKQNLPERFRKLFSKHRIEKMLNHLPMIAEILIEGVALNIPGAAAGLIRLLSASGNGGANEGRDELAEYLDNRVVAMLAIQKQLAERCNLLEEENASIRSEVERCTQKLTLLKAEIQAAKTAVESLQKRNIYFGWGLLCVGLLAFSELAWIFMH